MKRAYYASSIKEFLSSDTDYILGQFAINHEFAVTDLDKNSWKEEIQILKKQLVNFEDGEIAFEYTIPRIGHRIDTVIILHGIIFLLEFKVGDCEYKKSTDDQVMDYALDLKYFHEASKDRLIVPVNVSTEAAPRAEFLEISEDNIACTLHCNKNTIHEALDLVSMISAECLSLNTWIESKYSPTPTIIEAAQALYRTHSVEDIKRNDAANLIETTDAIGKIIDHCKQNNRKAICFITGVPGAGKTLAGLNIANTRQQFADDEHAVFLSGNGPLVDVLQEALAKDKAEREGITKASALRETKSFIQIIHRFRDEAITTDKPIFNKVAIFDEAQRAWDEKQLTDFMKRKKGVLNFNQSEPEFLIGILDRNKDWATIVCLVGGGQEINTGEAGIQDWFKTLASKYPDWEVYLSDKMTDTEYIGSSTIDELLEGREYSVEPSLHLGVSLRSFRSDKLASFTKALLDNEPEKANSIYGELSKSYPLLLTRNFETAKSWVKGKARGTERFGLLTSSEAKRLRGEGIWTPSSINHVGWFLSGKDNVDSSYFLEVAATEFQVQGLEVDYAILAWDADLRRENNNFGYYHFRGTKWNHVNIEQRQKYLKNAYRVLLTRARQGLIIYVPNGASNEEDATRASTYYDGIYTYLKSCGIKEL